ncbi:MAG: hypothetical protein ACI8WB_005196 [Phenylobacterium sp.]|jgi:hypothetical protein
MLYIQFHRLNLVIFFSVMIFSTAVMAQTDLKTQLTQIQQNLAQLLSVNDPTFREFLPSSMSDVFLQEQRLQQSNNPQRNSLIIDTWLKSFILLDQYIGIEYVAYDEPLMNVPVPYVEGQSSIAGMSANSIKDEKTRKAYIKAIEENNNQNCSLSISFTKGITRLGKLLFWRYQR